ncbi:hypothetical protein GQ473_03760 [archaeon]|nr:hypothetical protein [archaeon]
MFIDSRESPYHKIISLDENSPQYYPTLFKLSRLILNEKQLSGMDSKIEVLETVLGASIQAILITLMNFNDARAYFKHFVKNDKGFTIEVKITRFEVMAKLEEIRQYIFNELRVIQEEIRFSKVPLAV